MNILQRNCLSVGKTNLQNLFDRLVDMEIFVRKSAGFRPFPAVRRPTMSYSGTLIIASYL